MTNPAKGRYPDACFDGFLSPWSPESSCKLNAIIGELQKRGHRVIDSGDKAPTSAHGSLVLHYLDDWYWDMCMYLARLNIRVLDGSTSEPVAIGMYRTPFFHTYANSVKEVSMLFSRLDNQL